MLLYSKSELRKQRNLSSNTYYFFRLVTIDAELGTLLTWWLAIKSLVLAIAPAATEAGTLMLRHRVCTG